MLKVLMDIILQVNREIDFYILNEIRVCWVHFLHIIS